MKWFEGVVEDRNDPLQLGRVKIRCIGYHTENKQDLPTDDLPWAVPVQPITSAAMSGVGISPLGPVPGTVVVGFFRDGEDCQYPVFFGTLAGIPQEAANTTSGFSDPSGFYPKSDHLNEPDTNRLARGQTEKTIVEQKRDNIDEMSVPAGEGSSSSLSEPSTPYNTSYPMNKVLETESGHIQEFDDTPGSERIHTYHRSGTFEEIHPDGTKVLKVVGDNYTVIFGDSDLHVRGDVNIDIDGNTSISVAKNATIVVDGNVDVNAKGNMDLVADGRLLMKGASVKIEGFPIDLN